MIRLHKFLFQPVLVVLLVATLSCEEQNVRFDQPQPQGVKADTEIRKNLLGTYFSDQDSSWLHIDSKKVWISQEFSTTDSPEENSGDESDVRVATKGKESDVSVHVEVNTDPEKDSLLVEGGYNETLLDINQGHEARFFKGYYFLNKPLDGGNGFRVRILRPTSEGLLLCRIQSDSVLHLLENEEFVTKESSSDKEDGEESWILHPSRKELKKLIKMGLFSDIRLYKKRAPDRNAGTK